MRIQFKLLTSSILKNLSLVFSVIAFSMQVYAQGVTIGSTNPPDPSALLDLQSSQQGFLLPRMTTAQRDAIQNPSIGLQIVNITTECVEVYFSGGWKPAVCNCSQPPPAPSTINGPAGFCANQSGVIYSVNPVAGASSYAWTVPAGASIVSGQGTSQIVVNFGNTSGNVSVSASNTCGVSSTTTVAVNVSVLNAAFLPLSGAVNNPVQMVPQAGYASYAWTFQGGTPSSSSAQQSQVTWSSTGTYSVGLIVTDAYGCSDTAVQQITISNCQPFSHTFTTCGQTGASGPSQTQCNNAYGAGVVSVNNGIQEWVVPQTGVYRITCYGAQSSPGAGGGAIIGADIPLNAGDKLHILAGQEGTVISTYTTGGGGTFVGIGPTYGTASPLIVAGGGGGVNPSHTFLATANASTSEAGHAGAGGTPGGTGGQGGVGGTSNSGGGGGGFYGNGWMGTSPAMGGDAFQNGGKGGTGSSARDGGFGGGGGSSTRPGGGGGYSGGGPASSDNGTSNRVSGGGGSFVHASAMNVATSNGLYNNSGAFNGLPVQNLNSYHTGHGMVTVTISCP